MFKILSTLLLLGACAEPATTQRAAADLIAYAYCVKDQACHTTVVAGFCASDAACAANVDTQALDACLAATQPGYLPASCWLIFRS